MEYGLYQTLVSGNPRKRDINATQKRTIVERSSTLTTDQKEHFFMLIAEHAKRTEGWVYDKDNLPYDIKYENGNITFALSNFPKELNWILLSFVNKVNESEKL